MLLLNAALPGNSVAIWGTRMDVKSPMDRAVAIKYPIVHLNAAIRPIIRLYTLTPTTLITRHSSQTKTEARETFYVPDVQTFVAPILVSGGDHQRTYTRGSTCCLPLFVLAARRVTR